MGAASYSKNAEQVDLYFGLGCFWHMQHYFVEGERSVLHRGDRQLNSVAGYAGGSESGP